MEFALIFTQDQVKQGVGLACSYSCLPTTESYELRAACWFHKHGNEDVWQNHKQPSQKGVGQSLKQKNAMIMSGWGSGLQIPFLRKGRNPSFLPPAMAKLPGQTGISSLVRYPI